VKHGTQVLLGIALLAGCGNAPNNPENADLVLTDRMREACPTLPDEALAGYVAAIEQLQSDGLSQEDALVAWVQGCDSIPPDGNFGGDQELCAACVSVLVEEVYP
jgi:hypothetical protein